MMQSIYTILVPGPLLAGVFMLLLFQGCTHTPDEQGNDMVEVWSQPDWPPADSPAPQGFKITPAQAYKAVTNSKRLSLKHAWVCYRDDHDYYVADTFGMKIHAGNVRKHGVTVNGQSGEVH